MGQISSFGKRGKEEQKERVEKKKGNENLWNRQGSFRKRKKGICRKNEENRRDKVH